MITGVEGQVDEINILVDLESWRSFAMAVDQRATEVISFLVIGYHDFAPLTECLSSQ